MTIGLLALLPGKSSASGKDVLDLLLVSDALTEDTHLAPTQQASGKADIADRLARCHVVSYGQLDLIKATVLLNGVKEYLVESGDVGLW